MLATASIYFFSTRGGYTSSCDSFYKLVEKQDAQFAPMAEKLIRYEDEGNNRGLCIVGREEVIPAMKRWIQETHAHAKGQCGSRANRLREDLKSELSTMKKDVAHACDLAGL